MAKVAIDQIVMPGTEKLALYARDPLAFAEDLILPTPTGDRRFGDVMADFQRERFQALAPDLAALVAKRRPPIGRHWWEATKGCSKDTDLSIASIWLLIFSPPSRPLFGQVGAADQDQAAELRKAATGVIAANPWIGTRVVDDRNQLVCRKTGSLIEIVPADRRGSHGARPQFMVINELHAHGNREFADAMMNNARKVPFRVQILATNAGFLNSWQWQWRERFRNESLRSDSRWFFHVYDKPAPWIDPEDIEEAQATSTGTTFARLWQGIWSNAVGNAISAEDVEAAILAGQPEDKPLDGWLYAAGLDLSTRRDHSALVVVGCLPGTGIVRVVKVLSWRPTGGSIDLIAIRDTVAQEAEHWGLFWVGYDPFQAELMAQELSAIGVPMHEMRFAGQNLDTMASTLVQAFRSRSIQLYRDYELIADLYRLMIVERRFGGHRLDSPKDGTGHADRATALAIVLPTITEAASLDIEPNAGPAGPMLVTT